MLELLVRGKGATERVAIVGVVDGELEHPCRGSDRLDALQRQRDLELSFDVVGEPRGAPPTIADDGDSDMSKSTRAKQRLMSSPARG